MSLTADVVVIGAGLAGLVTALEAAEAGLEVLVLEKQPSIGGATVMSSGFFAFAGTDLQRANGIVDSDQLLYDDLREVAQYENDAELVRTHTTHQLATYEWLRHHGVDFGPTVEAVSGQSVPRVHTVDPAQVVDALARGCKQSGRVELIVEAPARRLVRDGPDGRVTGVRADTRDGAVTFDAGAGIVLTSGGFVHDRQLMHRCAPAYDAAIRISGAGNVGDGLRMARRLGGDFRDMAWIKGTYGKHPHDHRNNHACLAIYKGAIAVNRDGRRFVDESLSYKLVGDAALRQDGGITHQILDRHIFESGDDAVRVYDFKRRADAGLMQSAQTLDGLADQIGVPADALARTIDEYNRSIADGSADAFGRRTLVHHQGRRRPIAAAPFYAYPTGVAILGTYCGLCVDTAMRVIDVCGEPLAGLYAAGEIVGGFHGVAYMTGTSLAKAATFGRVAAQDIVTRAARSGH